MTSLTLEHILEMQRQIKALGDPPPPEGIDLYPNHAVPLDQCYELKLAPVINFWRPKDRRVIMVNPSRLQEVYKALRELGHDVRLEPVYRRSNETPSDDSAPPG